VTVLDVKKIFDQAHPHFPTVPLAEVELDPDTASRGGQVHDGQRLGVLINAVLVEGQLHGGVVAGIGRDLERRLDEDGQLMNGSYMEYALRGLPTVPNFTA